MASKRHAAQQEDDSDIDLTPMLDVVFIMLIFFIVTASFIKEAGLEIERPDSTSSSTPPSSENQNVLIRVTAASDIEIDGRRVDIRSVRSVIQRKLAENPKGSIIINAHPESKADVYTKITDAAQQAKPYVPVSLVVK